MICTNCSHAQTEHNAGGCGHGDCGCQVKIIDFEEPFEKWIKSDARNADAKGRLLVVAGLAAIGLGAVWSWYFISADLASIAIPILVSLSGDVGAAFVIALLLFPLFIGGFLLYMARKHQRRLS